MSITQISPHKTAALGSQRRFEEMNRDVIRIQAPCGDLIGFRSQPTGLIELLGIPYAEPPIGGRRFRPPCAKEPFEEPFEALKFGPASAQVFDAKEASTEEYGESFERQPIFVGSEDSLSLNVWTPGCDELARPVLIYLHGGANWLESSRFSTYNGTSLAVRGDIVVVTLNYRLGVFGALDLSALGEGAPSSAHANCVRDQLCGIDWVRNNIKILGGDPNNITLCGESAGSMDISWMLAAGALKDRVKRIVMMSGVGSVLGFAHDHEESAHSLSVGRAHAQRFWDEAGISSFKELEGLDTADLLTRVAHVAEQRHILFEMDTLFYPRVDPDFCSSDPFLATNNGAAEGLDIIIGFTDYELGLWLTWDDELDRKSARWAANTMPFLPKNLRADLALLYQRAFSHTPDGVQGMHLLSDAMFGAPSLIFANSATKNGANCWMYRFDYPAADLRRGALHAADLLFFLGTWDTDGGRKLLGESGTDAVRDERRRLSESMQDCLINFARRGMPSSSNLPSWPQFSINRREFMQFDIQSRIASNPLGGRGDFWLHEVAGPILK